MKFKYRWIRFVSAWIDLVDAIIVILTFTFIDLDLGLRYRIHVSKKRLQKNQK